jgi:hypothetical protein
VPQERTARTAAARASGAEEASSVLCAPSPWVRTGRPELLAGSKASRRFRVQPAKGSPDRRNPRPHDAREACTVSCANLSTSRAKTVRPARRASRAKDARSRMREEQ